MVDLIVNPNPDLEIFIYEFYLNYLIPSLRAQRSNPALDWLAALDFVRCARNDGFSQ